MCFLGSPQEVVIKQLLSYGFDGIIRYPGKKLVNSSILLLSDSEALPVYSPPSIQGRVSKVNPYQKDRDLEEI